MAGIPVIESTGGRLQLRGSITLATVQGLLDQGPQVFAGPAVRVDLSGVNEADSSAIALMLAWTREAAARGMLIAFENLPQSVRTLIDLYDVGELLPGV
jgi:phospholipid transport system transporter-binding protein